MRCYSVDEVAHYWHISFYGGPLQLEGPKKDEAMLGSLGITPRNSADHGKQYAAFFHDDNW